MTLDQFLSCNELDQMNAVWRAQLVTEVADEQYTYTIYQIDNFFIRVTSSKRDKDICKFEGFDRKETATSSV